MRYCVDTYMPVLAAGCDRANHREPEDHQTDEFAGQEKSCLENFSSYDLANRDQHHATEQCDEQDVFDESSGLIKPGKRGGHSPSHDLIANHADLLARFPGNHVSVMLAAILVHVVHHFLVKLQRHDVLIRKLVIGLV